MRGYDKRHLNIAFIHPDLGIGGAERLVIDAALGLQERGHKVTIYTNHCDKIHCFDEIKNMQLEVVIIGDFISGHLFGKLHIFFSTLKQLVLFFWLVLSGRINKHDLYVIDQLPSCIPLLQIFSQTPRFLFYCHFPDQLLTTRRGIIKKLYRIPFDFIEQFSTSASDAIVVNSKFTKSVFFKVFKLLKVNPDVIYPCVNLENAPTIKEDQELLRKIVKPEQRFYLSINRYERKKNIELAIQSYYKSSESKDPNNKLIISGGYDERIVENVEYLKELQAVTNDLGLSTVLIHYKSFVKDPTSYKLNSNVSQTKVIFITSISGSLKELLLKKTEMLLYTPAFEHFGIVPLEAMKYGKPVLAVDNGGPLETVVSLKQGGNEESATGWLRPQDPLEWAQAIEESAIFLKERPEVFKKNNPKHVYRNFSRDTMTESFLLTIEKMFIKKKAKVQNIIPTTILLNFALQKIILYFFPTYPSLLLIPAIIFIFSGRFQLGAYWVFAYSVFYMWLL